MLVIVIGYHEDTALAGREIKPIDADYGVTS